MNTQEIWIQAFDFENYEVSNLGRVKSLYDNKHKRRDKILKPQPTNCGYLRAVLRINNKTFYVLVHRLVMKSFKLITNAEKMDVNHINGIKTDNSLSNLEWNTRVENQLHAYKTGLQKPTDNGLKKKIAITDNNEKRIYKSIREMCRVENLDRRSVQRVIKGEINGYKNYTFSYE